MILKNIYDRNLPSQYDKKIVRNIDMSKNELNGTKILLENLIGEGIFSAETLDRILGAYTIFEYCEGKCLHKQANASYLKLMYGDTVSEVEFQKHPILSDIYKDDHEIFRKTLSECEDSLKSCKFRHFMPNGKLLWLAIDFFLLKKEGRKFLYCGVLRDITEESQKKQDILTLKEEMRMKNR